MRKWYTTEFDESQAVENIQGRDDTRRVQKGREEFNPMYLIKQVPADSRKLVRSVPLAF